MDELIHLAAFAAAALPRQEFKVALALAAAHGLAQIERGPITHMGERPQ